MIYMKQRHTARSGAGRAVHGTNGGGVVVHMKMVFQKEVSRHTKERKNVC